MENHDSINDPRKGLDLCEHYFKDVCYPMLLKEFSEYLPRMAAGLIGEGSECYGFDDVISRDHDFGPSFQIFIPASDMSIYGDKLKNKLEDIPLSTATNGKIFMDNLGEFSRIRKGLLNHYPKDVVLKRLAFHCTQIAQSGQYNLPRSLKRRKYVAASHALNEFIRHYTSVIYLINRTYKPYYKWEHEGLKALPILGQNVYDDFAKLVLIPLQANPKYVIFVVEEMYKRLVTYLREQNLTTNNHAFLLEHISSIMSHIENDTLRKSNPWLEK